MINELLSGIVAVIHTAYPEADIYTEETEQGLDTPCFFIHVSTTTNRVFMGNRRRHTNPFTIQYIPDSDRPLHELNGVIDTLVPMLESITSENIRGSDISSEIIDGALTINVNYDFFTFAKSSDPGMTSLTSSQKVKG